MNQVGMNKLKKNFSNWAIFSIVNNTKLNDKSVIGWRIVGGEKITVECFIRVIRKFRDEVVIRATDPKGRNTLLNLVASSEKLNFYLPDDMVLFQSQVKNYDDSGDVVIKMPSMIAQIDRRKHIRLFLNEEINVSVNFYKENHGQRVGTQQFNKKCFDISAGGLSFIISKIEGKFFQINDIIENLHINFEGRKVAVKGNIVNILEVEPDNHNKLHYKGHKVCIRYDQISPKYQKILNEFVFKYVDIDQAI